MPLGAGTYKLGPDNGTLSVRTGRTGAAAQAGHDLLLHVTAWQATLEVGDGGAQAVTLDADAASFRVREGTGGMQALADVDKASIQQTIDEEVLKSQRIEFRSTAMETAADGHTSGQGELTLVGETRPVAFDFTVDKNGRIRGSVVLTQTDWGITPYSTLFGALKVADEVEVAIDARLTSNVETWLSVEEGIELGELKPALLELYLISRASVDAQYRAYQACVNKRNEILEKLAAADRSGANQIHSELRGLKVELAFAIGGIKNHQICFEHLGGHGGDPQGSVADLIVRDFGSAEAWRADLKATGMAGRGWAWTAYDWDEGRLFNYIGDAQSTFPIWNATPLIALDVHEHAYFLDFQTDRGAYIDAFFDNLDWAIVNEWVSQYEIPVRYLPLPRA